MATAARLFSTLGKIGLGIAVVGGVASTALYNVDGGQRAIIFDRFYGVRQNVIGEGTHFIIPWVQRPIIFDIRTRPHSVPTVTGSKDLQNVKVAIRILYRPQADKLPQIYTNLGMDYEQRVLDSIVNEVLKAVVAQYDATELITQREMVSQTISDDLTTRAAQFGIILDDIAITDLSFGEDFKRAVERKQVAQQDAEKARFIVEKEEQLKLAAIIRAEGDSIAANLLAKAFNDAGEGLVELRKIEASEDVAYQMSQSPNVMYLPQGQKFLMALPQ